MDKKLIIINDLCANSTTLGKKYLQKFMYLLERHGLNLDLKYNMHFFGPYSVCLDYCLHEYESYGILNIDTSKSTHAISINTKITEKLIENDSKIENFVLQQYQTFSPLELEALTTIDYVAHTLYNDDQCENAVLDMVKKIKGSKFSDNELSEKYKILCKTGLIKAQ